MDVQALDDPDVYVKVRPTCFACNGFLFHKDLLHLQTSTTARFARIDQAAAWPLSPDFFALQSPPDGRPALIGFADGSVGRRTNFIGVTIEP